MNYILALACAYSTISLIVLFSMGRYVEAGVHFVALLLASIYLRRHHEA